MVKIPREEVKQIAKAPWNFFVRHPRVTVLILLIIIIWGLSSLLQLPREIDPEIDLPYGSVITVYPGANPLDVEELVTNEIESVTSRVEGIKTVTSSSTFGVSSVIIEFESDTDVDDAVDELESAVNIVKSELPEEAEDPIVSAFEANSIPVIIFSLLSDLPEDEFKEIAEDVKDELEQTSGVSEVVIIGARNKQVVVELKPEILERYGLTFTDVTNGIRGANINFPVGQITTDDIKYSLRIESAIEDARELANIPIKQFFSEDGSVQTIVLSDVATLREDLEEKKTIARVGLTENKTIKNAISLQIYKKQGGNIIQVAENAKESLEEMKGSIIPDSVDVNIANDYSEFLQKDLQTLGKNGITTIILIMILLFIFIGFKEAIIASISIPFAMLITFGILKMFDQTLNSLTLFSLVFALGLLIDNAVIIIEGIYENLKSGEYTPFGAAIVGIYQFKWPIIAGTLTTVFAFLPILGVSGIMGDFMSIIPITVTAILLSSLFVNLSITPTLSAILLKTGKKRNLFKYIQRWYKKFITNTIHSRFKKGLYLTIMTIVMVVSFSLPITGILKSEAFPISDFDFFYVDVETPPGTSLSETNKVVSEVEKILIEIPEIESVTTSIGTNAGAQLTQLISVTSNTSNIASLTINLVDQEDREMQSYEVSKVVREKLKNVQGGTVTITDLQGGPPSGAPIQAKITGPSLETLEEIALNIESKLKNIEGTLNVDTSIETGAGEFNITLNRDKLNFYGIAPVQVASLLRSSLEGVTASEIRKDGEQTDILVEYTFHNTMGRTAK